MTSREFARRARSLGCDTANATAQRLQLPPSSLSRIFAGKRKPSARVVQCLEDVERTQPVRYLSPLMVRVLMTEQGGAVTLPEPRSNFERSIAWAEVMGDLERAGLVPSPYGAAPWRLSALGRECVRWLRERA